MRLLKPSEIAEALSVTVATVHTMLNRGVLPSIDISASADPKRRVRRVREDDFLAFIDSRHNETEN